MPHDPSRMSRRVRRSAHGDDSDPSPRCYNPAPMTPSAPLDSAAVESSSSMLPQRRRVLKAIGAACLGTATAVGAMQAAAQLTTEIVGGGADLCHQQQHGKQQRSEGAAVHDGGVLFAIRSRERKISEARAGCSTPAFIRACRPS